ncbi:hypothetical protein D3C72_1772140 [compost metagenome]
MLRQQGQQRRPQQSVVVAKIRGGTGQQQGEVEDAGPVGHCGAAAVAHMDGPAFAGELLAGRLIAGQTHVLAGDNQALGRLPEVGAGQAVMGTVPQPALLLGQYLIRGVAGGQGGKQGIGHQGHPEQRLPCTVPGAANKVKPRTAGLYLFVDERVRPVRRRAWAAAGS